ncbi:VOC family protein [Kurthia massiliensis]|uniref:VOC family protein n=1 Tax=Kurthia massiliensis TaxID=1033739 RepID=UPI00028A1A14|nr:VOC family protein [Kurthia massiliensis]
MKHPFIHHVSVINRNTLDAFNFYHKVLGLDFLLKTVNQDDLEMYHIFFGDTTGRPGTEFSVFEMKHGAMKKFGTNSLDRTVFAVPSEDSLTFWQQRLEANDVFNCDIEDYNGAKILRFEDPSGVQLGLTAQKGNDEVFPRETADIPLAHAITGIDSIHCRVRYAKASARAFVDMFDAEIVDETTADGHAVTILGKADALLGQTLHLWEDRTRDVEVTGVGAIQHIALNVENYSALLGVEEKILNKNFPYSGIKNREFFQSLYYREPNNLLIEVATEQTEFEKIDIDTSNFDKIPLMLPSFLEPRRRFIESKL